MGDFFYSTLSYDRDKKNEREYRVQEGEPADTDLLHMDVVQLIGGRFFIGQNGRRTFPLSSVYPDVSNDDEGRQLHRRSGWSLCRIARDSQGTQGSPYKNKKKSRQITCLKTDFALEIDSQNQISGLSVKQRESQQSEKELLCDAIFKLPLQFLFVQVLSDENKFALFFLVFVPLPVRTS